MDALDLFFKKFSYKFPKGYPDINDEKDVLLLQSLLEQMDVPLYKVMNIKESAEDVKKVLIDAGYEPEDIIIKSKNQIRLLTKHKERMTDIYKLVYDIGFRYDKNHKGSSIGAVIAKDGTVILVKPKNRQGNLSAGLGNEHLLVDEINSYINTEPIDIVFKGKNKTISFDNITQAKSVGTDTKNNKKSDVVLYSGDKIVANLSIKQENAITWESADTKYRELVNKITQKLINNPLPTLSLIPTEKSDIYRLHNPEKNINLSGIIITDLPDDKDELIIFGTDNPKTKVIVQTFSPGDFKLERILFSNNNNVLTIKAKMIFTDLSDVEGTEYIPILILRHDSTRTATKGLRPLVYYKSHGYKDENLKGNQVELSYNEATS